MSEEWKAFISQKEKEGYKLVYMKPSVVDAPLTKEQGQEIHEMVNDFVRTMIQLSHRSDGIYGG